MKTDFSSKAWLHPPELSVRNVIRIFFALCLVVSAGIGAGLALIAMRLFA